MSAVYGAVLLWLVERRLCKVAGRSDWYLRGKSYEIWGKPR